MTLHPKNTTSTDTPPTVYVDKLSFRYASPDDDPEPGRKRATPGAETPDQPLAIEDISFSLPAAVYWLQSASPFHHLGTYHFQCRRIFAFSAHAGHTAVFGTIAF